MNNQINNQRDVFNIPYENTIVKNTNIFYPTPQKLKQLVKPDFSPIINIENKFGLKTNGSYKKRIKIEPESPIKTPSTNYLTPIKIEGKDLFGTKQDIQPCRKLNFDNIDKVCNFNNKIIDNEMNNFLNKFNMNDDNNFTNNVNAKNNQYKNNNIIKECNNRMENEFEVKKIIYERKLDAVYVVKEKKTGKIFCIKKISKKSKKNNFNIIQTIFDDFKKNDNNKIGEKFCIKYLDFWIENENYDLLNEDINYGNKNLYILLEYYKYGDILDYLEKLEKNNFKFTNDFYWDMIFEMIIGLLFFHKMGYIHFDIKPTNFIVDNNGYIKLNDFGLSHKIEELSFIDDINEGDSTYISKELFKSNDKESLSNIDNRCDVFSLGLSFLEIMAKIYLPHNGKLWKDIREDNFIMPNEFLNNWNIEDNVQFLNLIKQMISPVNKRPTLIELIHQFPELNKRYELLNKNKYEKSCELLKIFNNDNNEDKKNNDINSSYNSYTNA